MSKITFGEVELSDIVFRDVFYGMENAKNRLRITDVNDKASVVRAVYKFVHSLIDAESNDDSLARDYAYLWLAHVNWPALADRVIKMRTFKGNS